MAPCKIRQYVLVPVVAMSGGMTIGMCSYAFGSYVQPLTDDFGWSRVQINVAMTVNFVVYSLMGPVVGWTLDKHGARLTATIGLAVGAVGFAVMSLQRSLPVYYFAYAITGLAFPAATMPSGKVVSAWFGKKRGRMMGLVGAGNNLGGLIAVNISSLLARSPSYGWEYAAGVFACISATLSILYWIVVRNEPSTDSIAIEANRPTGQPNDSDGAEEERASLLESATPSHGSGGVATRTPDHGGDSMYTCTQRSSTTSKVDERPTELSFSEAVKLPVFWTTASGMLCAMWTYPAVLEQLQPALLAEGLAPAEAVSLVSAVATCGICGKLGSGLLSEKITARYTFCVLLLMQIVAMVIFLLCTPNLAALWSAFLLYGVGFGGVGAMLSLIVIDTFGMAHFGKIQGMIQLGVAVPSITAPILGGYIYDTTGNYHTHFAITIPIFVMSIVLLISGQPAVRTATPTRQP